MRLIELLRPRTSGRFNWKFPRYERRAGLIDPKFLDESDLECTSLKRRPAIKSSIDRGWPEVAGRRLISESPSLGSLSLKR